MGKRFIHNSKQTLLFVRVFAAVLIACSIRWFCIRDCGFDAAKWKDLGGGRNPDLRYQMVHDLLTFVTSNKINSRKDLFELLGKPDISDVAIQGDYNAVTYAMFKLGRRNSFVPSGKGFLKINFTANGVIENMLVQPE